MIIFLFYVWEKCDAKTHLPIENLKPIEDIDEVNFEEGDSYEFECSDTFQVKDPNNTGKISLTCQTGEWKNVTNNDCVRKKPIKIFLLRI